MTTSPIQGPFPPRRSRISFGPSAPAPKGTTRMLHSFLSVILALKSLLGVDLSPDLANALVAGADGNCARYASITAVCYHESNWLQAPRATILCGATHLYLPPEVDASGRQLPRRIDRSYSGQIGEVVRVFGTARDPQAIRARLANWRCGGRAPRCVATIGASYAERAFPTWTRAYNQCRRSPRSP